MVKPGLENFGVLFCAGLIFLGAVLLNGNSYAKPDQKKILDSIHEMKSRPTTPDNLQERSREIKQILRMLEKKHGRQEVKRIVSPGKKRRFEKAMRFGDYDTACRIADEIINNLASFGGVGKVGSQKKIDDEHIVRFKAGDGKVIYGYLGRPDGKGEFPYKYFDSPFGFHSSYYDISPYKNARKIGVRWDRGTGIGNYITPMPHTRKGRRADKEKIIREVKARIKKDVYNFDYFDRHIRQVPEGMHIVQNIGPIKKEATP